MELEEEVRWRNYSGKHFESIFTRFYQGYILPQKFGIDKRIAHLSTLINSEQLTKADAVELLKEDHYPSQLREEDFSIVCKKLGFSQQEMHDYMARPEVSHSSYGNDGRVFRFLRYIYVKLSLRKFSKYV